MSDNTRMTTEDIRQELTEWASHESFESRKRVFLRARAELLHLSTRVAKVKTLDWELIGQKIISNDLFGTQHYEIYLERHAGWHCVIKDFADEEVDEIGWFTGEDEAKAAAQKHFEKTILDQIEV